MKEIATRLLRFIAGFFRLGYPRVSITSAIRNSRISTEAAVGKRSVVMDSDIDAYSYIGLDAVVSKTSMGAFCSVGSGAWIGLRRHPTHFVSTSPVFYLAGVRNVNCFADQDYCPEQLLTVIEDDVWIGNNALIVDGVHVRQGAVIAAGAVVTKDVPPYAIVAGVPARVLRMRHDPDVVRELLKFPIRNIPRDLLKSIWKVTHDPKEYISWCQRHTHHWLK